jgi:excisionase family DNA binding protein
MSETTQRAGFLEQMLAEAQRPLVAALQRIQEQLDRLVDTRTATAATPKEYLTIAEVSARTKHCSKTVRRWIKEGRLKAKRWGNGRECRVPVSDLERFLGYSQERSFKELAGLEPDDEDVRRALAAVQRRMTDAR